MNSRSPAQVRSLADFAGDAARFIAAEARNAIASRGLFRLALAGGATPAVVYGELARIADLPWTKIQITFGDERCVPPEDSQSNFKMAKLSLFDAVGIPEGNIFRVRGEIDPEEAALEYEQKLAAVAARLGESRYIHDLILLGLGPDGHTASLFPGSPSLEETTRNIIPTIGPKPPPQRITMTLPLLNAARHIAFMVDDNSKKGVIDEILGGHSRYPAAAIQPDAGQVTWLIGPGKK
ncbi:MAG: pgl [Chthoniobacteraceae bacterium]|nr:pgl [Chthoniobacteraceae bacterium]